MPTINHAHTYERVRTDTKLYRCIHPDCYHIIPKELMKGKRSTCICGNEFIITQKSLRLKNPHCESCSKFNPVTQAKKNTITEVILTTKVNAPLKTDRSIRVDEFFFPEESLLESESEIKVNDEES